MYVYVCVCVCACAHMAQHLFLCPFCTKLTTDGLCIQNRFKSSLLLHSSVSFSQYLWIHGAIWKFANFSASKGDQIENKFLEKSKWWGNFHCCPLSLLIYHATTAFPVVSGNKLEPGRVFLKWFYPSTRRHIVLLVTTRGLSQDWTTNHTCKRKKIVQQPKWSDYIEQSG